MEPKLARRMNAFGIHFNPVGEAIEFNGKRMPYRLSSHSLFEDLAQPLKGFHRKIHSELNSALQAIGDVAVPTIDILKAASHSPCSMTPCYLEYYAASSGGFFMFEYVCMFFNIQLPYPIGIIYVYHNDYYAKFPLCFVLNPCQLLCCQLE